MMEMATQMYQWCRAIVQMMTTQMSAMGEQQHQLVAITERRFIQLEERIDNLEKQAKLDKK